MTARVAAVSVALLGLGVLGAPMSAATDPSPTPTVVPCPNGRPVGPHTACRGPAVHHSGGGVGALTIGLSVVVGLGVAAGAFVVVRRRITLDASRPLPSSRPPRRPS
jgi:hypothetical protein